MAGAARSGQMRPLRRSPNPGMIKRVDLNWSQVERRREEMKDYLEIKNNRKWCFDKGIKEKAEGSFGLLCLT